MKTTNNIVTSLYATHRYPIKLGHTGENKALRVIFSLAPFEEAFPGGRPVLLIQRRGDTQAYPAPLTVDGDTAYWTVTAADTAIAGRGQCELQWYFEDVLVKSDKFCFVVMQALEAGAEPPDDPSKPWFESVAVRYDIAQELTDEQQAQAVQNIGMNADSDDAMRLLSESGLVTPMYENGVFYTAKTGEIFVI